MYLWGKLSFYRDYVQSSNFKSMVDADLRELREIYLPLLPNISRLVINVPLYTFPSKRNETLGSGAPTTPV